MGVDRYVSTGDVSASEDGDTDVSGVDTVLSVDVCVTLTRCHEVT